MTARKLREWRGVKLAAAPSGAAAVTRLRTTPADDQVLNLVAAHLGRLRRADLAAASRPAPFPPWLDAGQLRQARRDRLNNRKRELTAQSSSRWASAVFKGTDEQYRLARRAQANHLASLQAAVTAIGKRLAQPSEDTLTREERAARKKARLPKGYATQAERFQKQRRLQHLNAEIARVSQPHYRETGNQIPPARHGQNADGRPVNRYPGTTGQQWPTTNVTVGASPSPGRAGTAGRPRPATSIRGNPSDTRPSKTGFPANRGDFGCGDGGQDRLALLRPGVPGE